MTQRAAKQNSAPSGTEPKSRQPERIHRVPAPVVENRALSRALGSGSGLPDGVRRAMESAFGTSLEGIHVHAGSEAAALADRHNADAFAYGRDIVFGRGKYALGTGDGDRLLAHEIAHILQQNGSGTASKEGVESEAREAADRAVGGKRVGNLSSSAPRIMRQAKVGGKPPKVLQGGTLVIAFRSGQTPRFPTTEEIRAQLREPDNADVIDACEVTLIGQPDTVGSRFRFTHPVLGRILDAEFGGSGDNSFSFSLEYYWLPPSNGAGDSGQRSTSGGGTSPTPPPKLPSELLSPDPKHPVKDPAELMRLYQLVREHLDLTGESEGEDIVRFAHFLELNKDKFEGKLQTGKGGFTEADIEKIVQMYGKFVAAQPMDNPGKLDKLEDYNKVFKYDPNWQKMSKQDRQMLLDYSKMSPQDIASQKLNFTRLTPTMKESMALKLADSFPSEVAEAAKAAFTDPGFIISLVLTIAIYIGLWLTPDPSFITKIAAGTLTAVMWAMFAWEDIWNTITEYSAFETNVKAARTAAELKEAGNRLMKRIGAVGFDILFMIATWGLGKAVGPKLRGIGAKRGVVRAEAGVSAAASDPAAGVPKPAESGSAGLLSDAKASAKGSTATAVLDALEGKLSPGAKEGLRNMRASGAGDMGTYKAIESQANKGLDVNHFLEGKAATPEARQAAQAKLLAAETKLARAQLIQTETIADPALREQARAALRSQLVTAFKQRLVEMGILDEASVKKAAESRDYNELTGALAEALSRAQLKASLPNAEKSRIVSNLAVVREVPGYKSIEAWKKATNASPEDVAKVFERDGKVYQSLGEIDSMVVEQGAAGKPKATLIEEVKSGAKDKPSAALKQVTEKVLPALQQMVGGDRSVHVFELKGKKALGAERTDAYDFSGSIQAQTRGPAGKGFDKDLGYDPEILQETAKSLVKDGLPPAGPLQIPPVTSPKDKEKEKDQPR